MEEHQEEGGGRWIGIKPREYVFENPYPEEGERPVLGSPQELNVGHLLEETNNMTEQDARAVYRQLDLSDAKIDHLIYWRRRMEQDTRQRALTEAVRQRMEADLAAESQCCTIMHKGGRVKKDGVYCLEKGERVIPKETFLSRRDKERRY